MADGQMLQSLADGLMIESKDWESKKLIIACIYIRSYSSDGYLSLPALPAKAVSIDRMQPSCILFDAAQNFVSFGDEAKDQYDKFSIDEKQRNYYFFQRFQTKLFNNYIKDEPTIEDVTGKIMFSEDVLSASIRYFKSAAIQTASDTGFEFKDNEYGWVITVPEVLTEHLRTFMKRVATKAGIQEQNLVLIREPEAVCIWCHYLHYEVFKLDRLAVPLQTNTDLLVVDTGCDGTSENVDITVYVIHRDNNPLELPKDSRWKLGNNPVDTNFRDLLFDVFGSDIIDEFKADHSESYIELFHMFHLKLGKSRDGVVRLRVPSELIYCFEEKRGVTFENHINSNYKHVCCSRNILRIMGDTGTSIVKMTLENIVVSSKRLLEKPQLMDVSTIIMFGLLAESSLLQSFVRESFPNMRFIVPENPREAVRYGALLYGRGSFSRYKILKKKYQRFSEK